VPTSKGTRQAMTTEPLTMSSTDGLEEALQAAVASAEVQQAPAGTQVSLVALSEAPTATSLQARPPSVPVPGSAPSAVKAPVHSPPRNTSFTASATAADIAQGLYQTLDEPVKETIMRDVRSIVEKIRYVMMPRARAERAQRLKDWDLWGPLLLCLALGLTIASQAANDDQASYAFADIFCIVWAGSGVVTLNALLLRGKVSFFQSVCVLGYCMCPVVIAAVLSMIFRYTFLKVVLCALGVFWSTGASVGYMSELVPEDRTALAVFPVWLFYIAIAWMVLLA